jgi:hypothetical protein
MIITIDTAKDSKDEIKRVVDFLSQLHDVPTNVPTPTAQPETYNNDMFGMFGNNEAPTETKEETIKIIKY